MSTFRYSEATVRVAVSLAATMALISLKSTLADEEYPLTVHE